MGLFSKPKAPKPMDVGAVTAQANAQNTANANQQTAYNRPNQTNQFGTSSTWSQTGTDANGNPTFGQSTNLSDPMQSYLGGMQALGQQYAGKVDNFISNRPDLSTAGSFDKAYDYASSTLNRNHQQQKDALDNKLKNQGLQPGTEAYDNAMRSTLDAQGDQQNSLITGIQGQLFNQGLAGRNQEAGEYRLYEPALGVNNTALTAGQQSVNPINVANVDVAQLNKTAYDQQYQQYQNQQQQQNAMLGGLAGLGGTILGGPIGGMIGSSMFGGGSSTTPGTAANGGWSTTTKPTGWFGY